MKIKIPAQDTKKWTKPSKGEVYGNLWATKNIDLVSNAGKIRLSQRAYRVYDSGDDADLEVAVKFIRTNADGTDRWWALTQGGASVVNDGLLFKTTGTNPLTGWTQDAIANTPTDCVDDMEIFGRPTQDRLVVARDTDLAMITLGGWTASWWQGTLGGGALTATNPHQLHQFINLLIVTDGNEIHTIDDSLVVIEDRLVLPKEYQVIWVADDGYRVYFGTRHIRGGEALVFPWDGTSATYDSPIPVGDRISFAGIADEGGVMHTINGKGQLLGYNGQDFVPVASLPIDENKILRWSTNDTGRGHVVHANGMTRIDGRINILLNGEAQGSYILENMVSGIWEYDPNIGLYHKYGIGQFDGSTNNEWGDAYSVVTGALTEIDKNRGSFLAGAEINTDNVATKLELIASLKNGTTNRGYFITSQINASDIRNWWKRIQMSFRKFSDSTDKLVFKYRTDKDVDMYESEGYVKGFGLTWTDTETFTIADGGFSIASIGDEIEFLQGEGAGALAHIETLSNVGITYTVGLDEAIPNVADTASCRVMNWTKLGEISSQSIQNQLFKIAKRSKWIQFKIELRGSSLSPEFEELIIEAEPSKR